MQGQGSQDELELPGPMRQASSIFRSGERRELEETALAAAIRDQVERWRQRGDWQKIQVTELLFVRGWANKDAARHLGITEQAVASYKFQAIARLKEMARRAGMNLENLGG